MERRTQPLPVGFPTYCRRLLLAALTTLAGSLLSPTSTPAQTFQIDSLSLGAGGVPRIRFKTDATSYYLLLRGSVLSDLSHPVDARLGTGNPVELTDLSPLPAGAFYRVYQVPQTAPLDVDRDGMDDLYELHRTPALNPLEPADALADADGDLRSNLAEARAGTDPLAADFFVTTSPRHHESGVSVNRETVLRFTLPLAAGSTLDGNHLWAEAGGRRLLTRPELSSDRRTATLFYLEPVPGATQVRVYFDGTGYSDATGRPLDLDSNGHPGGVSAIEFTTAGFTPVVGTAVIGRVFASEPASDPRAPGTATNRPLAGVTITVDGAEETLRTVTDAEGRFTLSPCPAGRFFVHVDGRTVADTAAGIRWPDLAYYPFVGKAWEAEAGVQTNLASGTGEIFLPLIAKEALRSVSPATETAIRFPDAVVAANPALAGVEVTVPPNALFNDSGVRGGRVGIAPVAPDRLPEPLPPGLSFPLVITVQTDGPQNFDQPVPVKFPNLPDPTTGKKLAPGAKSALWSFDHDKGTWEVVGPMTVSADGLFVVSDPGVGIRQPGWHGSDPGDGGSAPAPAPPPRKRPFPTPRPPLTGPTPPSPPPPPPPPPPGPGDGDKPGADDGDGSGDDNDSPIPDFPDLPDIPFVDEPESWGDLVSAIVDQLPTMGPDVFGPIVDIGKEGIEMFDDLGDVIGSSHAADSDGDGVPDVVESRDEFLEAIQDAAEDQLPSAPEDASDASNTLKEWWDIWRELYGGSQNALHSVSRRAGVHSPDQPPAAAAPFLTELRSEAADLERLAALQAAFDGYLRAVCGSNEWTSLSAAGIQFREVLPILRALSAAQQAGTDGGPLITPAEAAAIVLPPNSRIQRTSVTNLVVRLNFTVDQNRQGHVLRSQVAGGMTNLIDAAEERAALGALLDQVTAEADAGYRTPGDRGLALAGRMGPALGGFFAAYLPPTTTEPSADNLLPVLLEIFPPGGGQLEQRLKTDNRGQLPSLRVPADAFVIVRWLNPATFEIATAFFRSGPPGSRFSVPQAVWNEHLASLDSDGDGLPDAAERIVGTRADLADTDGDGLTDSAEVRAGSNPLDGIVIGPGIVGAADTPGRAVDVVAETFDLSRYGGASAVTRVLVADGPAGVAVLDLVAGHPTVLGEVDTPGDARRVALPPSGSLLADDLGYGAVADGAAGVGILDLSDPLHPRVVHQVALEGTTLSVTIYGGVAYAGSDTGQLTGVDLFTGEIVDQLNLGFPLDDLRVSEGTLWVVGPRFNQVTLQAVPLLANGFFGAPGSAVGSTGNLSRRGLRLAVGDGLAYTVHGKGYNSWIITNLFAPSLLATANTAQFGWKQIAPNGSGLGIACVGANGSDDGVHDVSVYDVHDPLQTDRFLRTIVTPGLAAAVAAHEGLALIVDTDAGLQVVRYTDPDRGSNAPTIALKVQPAPTVVRGARVLVAATSVDDVAVHSVDLYLNGERVASDHTWPFEFTLNTDVNDWPDTNLVVQARTVDTAGHANWSASTSITILPDTVPPQVVRVTPEAGRTISSPVPTVVVSFDEPLDLTTVTPTSIQLLEQGDDGIWGTADDRVVPGGVLSRLERANRVLLSFPSRLPTGEYRIRVAATVKDGSGNALGVPYTSDFRVRESDLRNGGFLVAEGLLTTVGHEDVYGFLANAGQSLFFDIQTNATTALRWYLVDPRGTNVFDARAFVDRGTVVMPSTGHYELHLQRTGSMADAYRVAVYDVPATPVFTIAVGDTVGEGQPAAGAGRIETPGVEDVYTFTADPVQAVFFDLQSGGTATLNWRLTDEAGTSVFTEGFFFDPGVVRLTRGGRYTLVVGNRASDQVGTYRFQLWDVPGPQTFAIALGDTVTNGVPAVGAGNIESPGATDRYTFTAAPGNTVYFDLIRGGTAALSWRLTDESDTEVFANGFFFDPGTITLTRGGTYTLTIGNPRSDTRTSYSFRVTRVPAPTVIPIAIDTPVREDQPVAGAGRIETPGSLDVYTFSAAPGQAVFFDLQSGGTAGLSWSLTDDTGAQVFSLGFFFDPGVVVLTRGGTYTLTIGNARSDTVGPYRFRLWSVPAPQRYALQIGDTVSDGVPAAGAGNIESPGAQDVYTFVAGAGQVVFFDLLAGGTANQNWRLTDEAGTEVFSNGFFFDPGAVLLTRGGTYTLTIGNPKADVTGTYRFQIRSAP